MADPRVSVVIPVYNRAALVCSAIASVQAQTFQDFEIVLVDDASTDALRAVLDGIVEPRLRYVRRDVRGGAAAARNTAIALARGRYLAFLDSDDAWFPRKLARQHAYLDAASPEVGLCCCGFELESADESGGYRLDRRIPRNDADSFERLLWGCDLSPGATLVARRECFEAVGPFDEALERLEDWDWLLRYARSRRIGIVEQVLARVRVTSRPPPEIVFDSLRRIEEKHLAVIRERDALAARKFKSTLLLERAAAFYRAGRRGAAVGFGLLSLTYYPFRNAEFFLRQLPRLLQVQPRDLGVEAPRPKVMHVITGLGQGGAERMLTRLVLAAAKPQAKPGLASRDDLLPPVVVSLVPGGENAAALEAAGVPVFDLGMRRGRPSLPALLRLACLIRRERPDVIQSWMYHADLVALLALLLSGLRRRVRLYWGIRCSDMDFARYGRSLRWIVRLCAALSRLPYGVVANSEAGLRMHRALGYRAKRFYVVDNGIEVGQFALAPATRSAVRRELGLSEDAVVVIHLARVDPMKDHATLLSAFREVEGATLLLVGAGTEALPSQPQVRALGARGDVPRLLQASDILVLSSAFGEGFSNAIAEGMAAGLPVVATDVGDAARIVDGCGIVVPPRDPQALAAALSRLIADKAERRRLGASARERIARCFSLERAFAAFDRVYRGEGGEPSARARPSSSESGVTPRI